MGFKLDDIVIDRVQYGVAEDFDGNLLYVLTQLSEASVEITGESKDATDAQGTLIKRFWQGKSGEFTATNALVNLNVIGEASGSGKLTATEEAAINMPKIVTVKAGQTISLVDQNGAANFIDGTVHVNALSTNGAMGKAYEKSDSATENAYALTTAGVLTPPTDAAETQYIIKYQRKVTSGGAIENRADKFPRTVKLTLKALAVDPCTADTLRGIYIEFPSFQVSPEVNITLDTEEGIEFSGALQVDYCSADKSLYRIYWAEEDEEEEE